MQVSDIIVTWTPETSGRVSAAQIRSRIVGTSNWSEQAASADATAGTFRFTANAPDTDVEVQIRYRMVSGGFSPWISATTHTAPAVVRYDAVTGRPTSLSDINAAQGTKLGGIAPGADVTGANTAKDTAAVNGVAASTVTTQLSAIVAGGFADSVAPSIPTGLALSSALTDAGVTLNAVWNPVSASDFAGYVFAIKEGAGNYVEFTTTGASYSRTALPRNTSFTAKVAAFDKAGNRSAFSGEVTTTTARDTVAPAVVTGVSVTTTYNTAFIKWTNPADADLRLVYLTVQKTSDGSTVAVDSIAAQGGQPGTFTITGLTQGTQYVATLAARDTSGNQSAGIQSPTFTTAGGVAAGDFTPGLSPIQTVASLPAAAGYTGPAVVFVQGEGKLYRYAGGAWTKSTDGADIITGTIQAAQIATGALNTRVLAVGNPDSIIPDSNFNDNTFWANFPGGDSRVTVGAISFARFQRGITIIPNGGIDAYSTFFPVEVGASYRVTVGVDLSSDFSGWFTPTIHMPGYRWSSLKRDAGINPETTDPVDSFTNAGYSDYSEFVVTNSTDINARQWQFRFRGSYTGRAIFAVRIVRVSDTTLIKDGAITTPKVTVNSLNGDRIQAGTLDANRVQAGTVLSNLVQVANTYGSAFDIGAATVAAYDPANRINSGPATTVQPGKITISGGTTLSDWRQGGDTTRIAGGAVSANTISANKLTIGNRNISTIGLAFQWNPANNYVDWTNGYIYYQDDNGNTAQQIVDAGSTNGAGAHRFFYWIKDTRTILHTQDANAAVGADRVMLGSWWGGADLNLNIGGTIINGDRITTGTVDANRIKANTVLASNIVVGGDTLGKLNGIEANANRTTNTNQLSDGAGLGSTANWSQVNNNNGQKPQDGATVGAPVGTLVGGVAASTVAIGAESSANNSWFSPDSRFYTFAGNRVTKTFNNAWDTSAYTREVYVGACVMTGRLATDGTFIGLSDGRENGNFSVFRYSFHRSGDGNCYIYENGGQIQNVGSNGGLLSADAVNFTIVYDGRTVRYYRDSQLLREVGSGPNRSFSGAVGIYSIGQFVDKLSFSQGADNSLSRADPAQRINENVTTISGGKITAYSVDASRLNVGSLSAISANIGLLRTATSGARTEIESNQIRVYDSNGVLRVRMGVW